MQHDVVSLLASNALRDQYVAAAPWPHLIFDDFLDAAGISETAAELRALPDDVFDWQRTPRIHKGALNDLDSMGERLRNLCTTLTDTDFIGGLARLTSVGGLTADQSFTYAGIYVTPPGGWQRVHEDFPRHPTTGLWNRVAVLLYLGDWSPGDGGELELWPRDMEGPPKIVDPRPGRMVVFEPSSTTLHGIRTVSAGADRRVSLGLRYYSPEAPRVKPSPVYRRTVRRPGERLVDVMPGLSEVRAYVLGSGSRVKPSALRQPSP